MDGGADFFLQARLFKDGDIVMPKRGGGRESGDASCNDLRREKVVRTPEERKGRLHSPPITTTSSCEESALGILSSFVYC